MAYFGFTNKLVKGETIKIFNYGNCKRDFTYVDDIVEGVVRIMQHAPEKRGGRGIDQMLDFVVTTGLQNVVKPNDIALNIGIGIGDRIPHTSLSGKVYDNIYRVVAKQPINDRPE